MPPVEGTNHILKTNELMPLMGQLEEGKQQLSLCTSLYNTPLFHHQVYSEYFCHVIVIFYGLPNDYLYWIVFFGTQWDVEHGSRLPSLLMFIQLRSDVLIPFFWRGRWNRTCVYFNQWMQTMFLQCSCWKNTCYRNISRRVRLEFGSDG